MLNLCALDPSKPIVLSFMHFELSLLGPPLFVCVALNAKSFTGTPLPKVKLVTMFAQKLGWGPPSYSDEDVTGEVGLLPPTQGDSHLEESGYTQHTL